MLSQSFNNLHAMSGSYSILSILFSLFLLAFTLTILITRRFRR